MDVVIDAIADGSSFTVALESLHHGGIVLVLHEANSELVQLPMSLLVGRSITIKAIKTGSRYLLDS